MSSPVAFQRVETSLPKPLLGIVFEYYGPMTTEVISRHKTLTNSGSYISVDFDFRKVDEDFHDLFEFGKSYGLEKQMDAHVRAFALKKFHHEAYGGSLYHSHIERYSLDLCSSAIRIASFNLKCKDDSISEVSAVQSILALLQRLGLITQKTDEKGKVELIPQPDEPQPSIELLEKDMVCTVKYPPKRQGLKQQIEVLKQLNNH